MGPFMYCLIKLESPGHPPPSIVKALPSTLVYKVRFDVCQKKHIVIKKGYYMWSQPCFKIDEEKECDTLGVQS